MNLFCIPYAGGSAATYYRFQKPLSSAARVIPLEPPGKGMREDEPPAKSIRALAESLCDTVASENAAGEEYALFGYSMGGVIAYELYRETRKRGLPLPSHMIFAACEAPNVFAADQTAKIYLLPDDEFLRGIEQFGFVPEEIKSDPELRAFFLPILRQDFRLAYAYREEGAPERMLSDVHILYSDYEEKNAPITAWNEYCAENARYVRFTRGAHFFLNAEFERVMQTVITILRKV